MEKSREGNAEGEVGQKGNGKDVPKSQSEAYHFTTFFKIYIILRYYTLYSKIYDFILIKVKFYILIGLCHIR